MNLLVFQSTWEELALMFDFRAHVFSLGWSGLDWIGLDWTGLDYTWSLGCSVLRAVSLPPIPQKTFKKFYFSNHQEKGDYPSVYQNNFFFFLKTRKSTVVILGKENQNLEVVLLFAWLKRPWPHWSSLWLLVLHQGGKKLLIKLLLGTPDEFWGPLASWWWIGLGFLHRKRQTSLHCCSILSAALWILESSKSQDHKGRNFMVLGDSFR